MADPERITDPAVAAVVAGYPEHIQARVLALRGLVIGTAAALPEVGPLTETLRWGQPSYLTAASGSGTTIRLGWDRRHPDAYSLFLHCGTTLVDTFRTLYPQAFDLVGNREIRFAADRPVPVDAVRDCVELALTYRLRRG